MSKRHIDTESQLDTLAHHAQRLYGAWAGRAAEVEDMWKGEVAEPDITDPDIEITRFTKPRIYLEKMERMLAVRGALNISCVPEDTTKKAAEKAERRERALRAFMREHQQITQRNVFRDAVFFDLLRGRGPIQVRYEPEREDLKLRLRAPDPMGVFPVWTDSGIDYVVTIEYMTRLEVEDYFDGLSETQREKMMVPSLRRYDDEEDISSPEDMFEKVEYWDAGGFAWSVDGHLVQYVELEVDWLAWSEARFLSKPLKDEEYASSSPLGIVLEDLKQWQKLLSKQATAVSAFYYPILVYKTEDGMLATLDSRDVGEFHEVSADFQPIILNPTANDEGLGRLMAAFEENVGQGTLSPIVFNTDLSNVPSGFMVEKVLSTIKDDLADYQKAIEMTFSRVLSTVLRFMEAYADEQEGGGWKLPLLNEATGRNAYAVITAEDIDGNYAVEVELEMALPHDRIQMVTIYNQLLTAQVDHDTALEISGLAKLVDDRVAMKRRMDWEYLKANDQEVAALYIEKLKADYAPEMAEWERNITSQAKKDARRDQRQAASDIERGLTQDVVLPAEIASDPAKLHQFAQLVEQGILPEQAVQVVLNDDALTMGQPAPQGETPDPELQGLLNGLFGGPVQVGEQPAIPDGFTGYDNGIPPSVASAASQGAQPRQVMDQARVEMEGYETDIRRGGLPPAK